ncbi:MAG TPA: hypothetical protein VHO47_01330 [Candidatus Babeliales bacterium]|nr:hypothetical protein [Candidatus Babeliales bacterium]
MKYIYNKIIIVFSFFICTLGAEEKGSSANFSPAASNTTQSNQSTTAAVQSSQAAALEAQSKQSSTDKNKNYGSDDSDSSSSGKANSSRNSYSGVMVMCKAQSSSSKANYTAIDNYIADKYWKIAEDRIAAQKAADIAKAEVSSSAKSKYEDFLERVSNRQSSISNNLSKDVYGGYKNNTSYRDVFFKYIAAASASRNSNANSRPESELVNNSISPQAAFEIGYKALELADKYWSVIKTTAAGAAIVYGTSKNKQDHAYNSYNNNTTSVKSAAHAALHTYNRDHGYTNSSLSATDKVDKVYTTEEIYELRVKGVDSRILTVDAQGNPILDESSPIYPVPMTLSDLERSNQLYPGPNGFTLIAPYRNDGNLYEAVFPKPDYLNKPFLYGDQISSQQTEPPKKIDTPNHSASESTQESVPAKEKEPVSQVSNEPNEDGENEQLKDANALQVIESNAPPKKMKILVHTTMGHQNPAKKKMDPPRNEDSDSDSRVVSAACDGGMPPDPNDPNNWKNKKKKKKFDESETEKFKKALEYARNPNKLRHYFENSQHDHGFDEMLDKLGGRNDIAAQTKLVEEVILERMRIGSLPFEGSWNEVEVNLYGEKITVRCFSGDQVLKISTMFIKTKFKPRINKVT